MERGGGRRERRKGKGKKMGRERGGWRGEHA